MERPPGEDALIALRQIFRATDLDARRLARETGLTPSQLRILSTIEQADAPTVGQIASAVALRQATITVLIDKLEERNLVERRRSVADRRRVEVHLTPAGQQLLKSAPAVLQDIFLSRFSVLEDWERSWITAALQRVAKILDAEALDAAPLLDVGTIPSPAPQADD